MSRGAEVVIIGNEILSGKVPDDNGPFLVRELRALGASLQRVTVIQDDVPIIAATIAEAASRAAFVITTGGVGPTLDDVTFEGVAAAFGMPLVRSAPMTLVLREYFRERATEAHFKMAMLPSDCELLFPEGLRFPVVRVRNVYVFPGSPELLRSKFLGIKERFRDAPFFLRRVFTTLEEGDISAALDLLHAEIPAVAIGSYPVFDNPRYAVQITLESKQRPDVERALARLLELLDPVRIVAVD